MGKYNSMKFWVQSIAQTPKICQLCKRHLINLGDIYYREKLTDPKINFIGKKICCNCYKNLNKRI